MSDIEWEVLRFSEKDGLDVRAVRRMPGPPPYLCVARWVVGDAQIADPTVARWLVRSMLRMQRRLDAQRNVKNCAVPPVSTL